MDPRWQKRRLEILSRDNFTCVNCGSTEKTLHIHHQKYCKDGRDPWEYNDYLLVTLCCDCHKQEEVEKTVTAQVMEYFLSNSVLISDVNRLLLEIISAIANHRHYQTDHTPHEIKSRISRIIDIVKVSHKLKIPQDA